jgi:hypothetical protein
MALVGCKQAFKRQKRLASVLRAVLHRAISQRRYIRTERLYRFSYEKLLSDPVIKAATWFTPDPSQVVSANVINVGFCQKKTDLSVCISNPRTYSNTSRVVVATLNYTPLSFLPRRHSPTCLTKTMTSLPKLYMS